MKTKCLILLRLLCVYLIIIFPLTAYGQFRKDGPPLKYFRYIPPSQPQNQNPIGDKLPNYPPSEIPPPASRREESRDWMGVSRQLDRMVRNGDISEDCFNAVMKATGKYLKELETPPKMEMNRGFNEEFKEMQEKELKELLKDLDREMEEIEEREKERTKIPEEMRPEKDKEGNAGKQARPEDENERGKGKKRPPIPKYDEDGNPIRQHTA